MTTTATQTSPADQIIAAEHRVWTLHIPQDRTMPVYLGLAKHHDSALTEAAQMLRCTYIEPVHPLGLRVTGHCLLVDEEGRYNQTNGTNARASYLYGSQLHGLDMVGDTVVATTIETPDGPDIAWLTIAEAQQLLVQLARLFSEEGTL